MDTVTSNEDLRNNATALRQIHDALIVERNAAPDRETWLEIDHRAKKVWNAWIETQRRLTMRSEPESYRAEQRGR